MSHEYIATSLDQFMNAWQRWKELSGFFFFFFKKYLKIIVSITTNSGEFDSSANDICCAIYSESLPSTVKPQKSSPFKSAARIYYIWKDSLWPLF